MRKAALIFILCAASLVMAGCNAHMVLPGSDGETPPTPVVSEPPSPGLLTPKIRLSEELYMPMISLTVWKPYFTGEEPEWRYNPDEPWLWNREGENSFMQEPAMDAHTSLYPYLENYANYAGCYVNSNGYLTVMLTEPTMEQAIEIGERSAAPVWIVAANYSYEMLRKALDEVFPAITSWMAEHPEAPIGGLSGGVRDDVNRVYLHLSGSGIPMLLDAFDFPGCIELIYTLTVDPSLEHSIPRAPETSWIKDGVTIRSARESYPVGTTFIPVVVSHNVENMRLYAPESVLRVDKYVSGEWFDVSGSYFMNDLYIEMLDIPANVEKTVYLEIVTPETLGPGLYRATYGGVISFSSFGDTPMNGAIAGIGGKDMVVFEFTITADADDIDTAEYANPSDQAKAYMEVFYELYKQDPGLNGDIIYIALDLSDVLLTDTEPLIALMQAFCHANGFSLLLDTMDGLMEKGYILDLYFKDGIVIGFSDTRLTVNELVTSARKWRSGLGAIGADYTVAKSGFFWAITETGGFWIS